MRTSFVLFLLIVTCAAPVIGAAGKQTLVLENADELNVRTDSGITVWYGYGNVRLKLDSSRIQSDTVIWFRDKDSISFLGHVESYDGLQHLWARSVIFSEAESLFIAEEDVVMIQHKDSIKTESERAEYDRGGDILCLTGSPILYLNHPDTANLVSISGDSLTFHKRENRGTAVRNVVISHRQTRAYCGRAEFDRTSNFLMLFQQPRAMQDSSEITGRLMEIDFRGGKVRRIDVFDSAAAIFEEQGDSVNQNAGHSELYGKNISFSFENEEVRKIAAVGSARSVYFPSPDDTTGTGKNIVSGDSIFIFVEKRRIAKIEVKGGAEGVYITERKGGEPDTVDDSLELSAGVVQSMMSDSGISADQRESESVGPADDVTLEETMSQDTVPAIRRTQDSIQYQGDFLEYFAAERIIRMTGNSHVRQGTVALDADQVDYYVPQKIVMARSKEIPSGDTTIVKPLALKDAGERIFGTRLVYNVDTKKGLIENATTAYEQAYYGGDDLYKETEKVFYVNDGSLSSCELDEPHFHFSGGKMKVIHDDRVIARPVTLYLETLPVLTIPYYIFPLKRGRHSGILPIRLGNFERGNRFIGNLGYYWAASEYLDIETALDFYENTGMTLNSFLRYSKRYAFSGTVRSSYAWEHKEFAEGEQRARRWSVSGDHTQTLPYEIKFGASGTFLSDKSYYSDFSTNPDERRNRSLKSQANFSKSLGWGSLNLSFNNTRNLDADSRQTNIPSGGFSVQSFRPFGSGRESDSGIVRKWYNQLFAGYRNSFVISSDRSKTVAGIPTRREFGLIDHSASLSASQNVMTYVALNPNASFNETWYYVKRTDQSHARGIPQDVYRRGAVQAGVSATTNLYGTFPVGLFGLSAMRHVLTPSLAYSWAPSVTKNDKVRSYLGRGGGGGRQQTLSGTLQHLFQAKIGGGESQKKLDLLRISSALSHNFEAKEKKFSDLRTTVSSTLIRNVNLSGSMAHDLYTTEDKLHWKSPRLMSFSIATSFQARGSVADNFVRQNLGANRVDTTATESNALSSVLPPAMTGNGAGWNLNLSHNYSESGFSGARKSKTHWLRMTAEVNLTPNWRIRYQQSYDFVRHQTTEKSIEVFRRLHCWEGNFRWIPEGSYRGFYFRLNVIAIPDLKFEKSETGLRGALLNR